MLTLPDPKITPSNQNPPHKWLSHTIPLQIGEIGFEVTYGELFIVVGNIIWKIVP
jgi:hypothetical protein